MFTSATKLSVTEFAPGWRRRNVRLRCDHKNMKRCPQCNRVETDEALKFCRVDGATLISGSSPLATEAGTAKLDSASAEIETSILPHSTNANVNRATGPTTVLPAPTTPGTTRELTTPKRHWIAILLIVLVAAVASVGTYFYFTRKTAATIQSIAVMPFINESGNAGVEYLSDGLTESLINSLSRLPNLSVKARSTVFRYKGRDISPQQVGSELSVQAVLNGRVGQRGEQLTVSVDLVDGRTGDQIWGQQYNDRISDAVSLQVQIASEVSRRLQGSGPRDEQNKLNKGSTNNADAYLLYLKGQFQTAKYTKDGVNQGRSYFEQAIALDPRYALAYAGLADNYVAASDWYMPSNEALAKTESAARKALELDDQLSEAHTSLAIALWWYDRDWSAAESEFKRAIELNANDARPHEFYGWFLVNSGRNEAALTENNRARQLDPLSSETNTIVGQTLYFVRRYDEAVAQLKSTLDLDQNYWLAHSFLGRTYEQQGKFAEAIAEFQRALDLEKDVPENYAMLAHVYGAAGKKSEGEKLLTQLQKLAGQRHVPAYNIAMAYVGLGDKDQAFAWLEKAYADRSFYITWLGYDPQLDSLRSDPRFADLVKRVGRPQ